MERIDELSGAIIAAAIEVHRHLGPGMLEKAYEECLSYELANLGLIFRRQQAVPVTYKGITLDCGYRMDLLVEDQIVVELKTVDVLLPVHHAQILTYMKFANKNLGLLINFNATLLKKGLKRFRI
ncbi:MAG: GxxExxY protein [Bacteroidota bacterium]